MLAAWFLFAAIATNESAANAASAPPVRVEATQRFVIRSEGAVKRVTLTVAVPQDAGDWQDVITSTFQPKPSEVFERNGQRYARFILSQPAAETTVEICSHLELGRNDFVTRGARKPPAQPKLAAPVRKLALTSERFVESDHEAIRTVAKRISGKTPLERTRSALDLTLEHLAPAPYDPRSIGARGALDMRRGDCTEYSDLLTALLRADGIPARRSYATPKHDWVEVFFYDLGWVLIDPLHVERGAATFESAKPNYVQLSTLRSDDTLSGYYYFAWQHDGGAVTVTEEYELAPRREGGADVTPSPAPSGTRSQGNQR
jgi:transglutaminase-like putative cysteine protease